jgi:hypothetical protein
MTTTGTQDASPDAGPDPAAGGRAAILELQHAAWRYAALRALILAGCPAQLQDGPLTVAALAERCGADPVALRRILRAVAQTGLFASVRPDSYRLTAAGQALVDGPLASALAFFADRELNGTMGDLPETLATGSSPFMRRYGSAYGYLEHNPALGAHFDRYMAAGQERLAVGLAQADGFPATGTVVDVGGGKGQCLAAILRDRPGLRGILLDVARAIGSARQYLTDSGVYDRCELVAGDFFAAVPEGADVYFAAHIVHLWDDEQVTALLRVIRAACPRHGRLIIMEHVLPAGDQPGVGKDLDIRLLALGPGRERSHDEYNALLAAAGFSPGQLTGIGGDHFLITARPVAA